MNFTPAQWVVMWNTSVEQSASSGHVEHLHGTHTQPLVKWNTFTGAKYSTPTKHLVMWSASVMHPMKLLSCALNGLE